MIRKIIRDCSGASLIEFTLVFPIVMSVLFGTVDVLYMLHEWNLASKATYRGARVAIVSTPPVAALSNPPYDMTDPGRPCFVAATGAPDGVANCPVVNVLCDSTTCNNDDFSLIVDAMQQIFPPPRCPTCPGLRPENVQVRYQSSGLGFTGQPGGLPMNVTVSLQCMYHTTWFLGAWLGWLFAPPSACLLPRSIPMPPFASTLPSEDIATN